nr:immunoglobulin light chain junction region [Macaca mulatta]MOW67703.1 immunoglobulin light chain junction region [Macaca mulatta]MOW67828.1 immunoglobulin light chain junction region [Macaca mulatta]MOW69228.1 immunoglobulin light chain junction region [Macaca mulatta]MOW70163.1 immunoglobulin light chain junction region [Macaca mulatta]
DYFCAIWPINTWVF